MQPLENANLESRAVAKRAARGHADLVEQVVSLGALAAAHLVADGDERSPCGRVWLSPASFFRAAPDTAPCPGLRAAARQ